MQGNFKSPHALAVLGSAQLSLGQAEKFAGKVAREFQEIARSEKMNAVRAIAVGFGLHAVKATTPGKFRDWQESHLASAHGWSKGTAVVNASYYMRLAIVAAEELKITKPELLTLTAGKGKALALDKAKGDLGKLVKRLETFVGERSLNEMLTDYGIKGGGSSGGATGTQPTLPAGASEDPLFADTAQYLMGLRDTLLKPDTLKRFSANQLEEIERQFAHTFEEFRKLRAAMGTGEQS